MIYSESAHTMSRPVKSASELDPKGFFVVETPTGGFVVTHTCVR